MAFLASFFTALYSFAAVLLADRPGVLFSIVYASQVLAWSILITLFVISFPAAEGPAGVGRGALDKQP